MAIPEPDGANTNMFRDRQDAGLQLATRLKGLPLKAPIVLSIPRGGVVIGAVLARALSADLDVVLSRKLRAPFQSELAIGAVSEDGQVQVDALARTLPEVTEAYLERESHHQLEEIRRRRMMYRKVRPQADVAGRSVIVTDDGIATGATLLAALKTTQARAPYEIIAAVPVSAPDRLETVREQCSQVICLLSPPMFWAIGQFYERFDQVDDAQVLALLREFAPAAEATER